MIMRIIYIKNFQGLPRNKVVQFGKHFIDFNPIVQILSRFQMFAFVDHDPAHVCRAVLAGGTVAGG